MKKLLLLIAGGLFLFSSCESLLPYDENEYFEETFERGEDGDLSLYAVDGNSITIIRDFEVPKKYLDIQDDKELHADAWEFVTKMIPEIYRSKITQYQVFHGEGELLGFVTPVDHNDLSKWKFALGIDQASGLTKIDFSNDFVYTIIHEYGHILTLNDEQIDVVEEGACGHYFTGEGCAKSKAYINKLVEIGWTDILEETRNLDAETIYERYSDRFSTEYAATNPGEDVAEVFTLFVIQEGKPKGHTIADKKIQAMYDFPSLVRLREDIRKSIGTKKMQSLSLEEYKSMQPMLSKEHKH